MKNLKPIFLSIVLLASLLLTGCSSILYHPTKIVHYDPAQLGLVPIENEMEVAPGVKIHGWYLKAKAKNPKGVFVFFHGNAENLTSHYVSLSWILKQGYDYYIWDYRSYGKSKGNPSPKNTVSDGKEIIRYIYNKNPNLPLYIFAQSLGGIIAMRTVIDLKNEIPIRAVVVDSTAQSYQSVGREILSRHWLTWLLQPLPYILISDKYTPEDRVGEISPIPLLVIHGTKDQVINYKFGEEVFKDAKDPKEFISIENGTHIDSFWGRGADVTRKKFLEFVNKYQ